jgi:excisionase family DNA binding protein
MPVGGSPFKGRVEAGHFSSPLGCINLLDRLSTNTQIEPVATKRFATGEAAEQIGISRQTLQQWIASRRVKAPKAIKMGRLSVRLWTKAEIHRARQFKGTLKRGPQAKKRTN